MEEPAFKRPKLLADLPTREDWDRWSGNLGRLQEKLLTGCLCNVETIELQRPLLPSSSSSSSSSASSSSSLNCPPYYTLEFISTINLLSDTALGQHGTGFICPKILDMAAGVSTDERIWELLLESLNSLDKFIGQATTKCVTSFLLWTKLPNLDEIFNDLFNSVFVDGGTNPGKLSQTLDVIRGIIEHKEIEEHPLGLQIPHQQQQNGNNDDGPSSPSTTAIQRRRNCIKIEVDTEIESEVKNMCIRSLENWWTRLLSKFHHMLTTYDNKNEAAILTFLSLWQSVISVKSNLSVVETKHFHTHLEQFVPHLNASLPSVIWKKILDVFSEILCYGSTLSLQDELADEPCNLAHLIIRCVKNRQFLQSAPYSRSFSGFGGSSVGAVEWESDQQQQLNYHQANLNSTTVYPFKKSSSSQHSSSTSLPSSSSSNLNKSATIASSSTSLYKNIKFPSSSSCSSSSSSASINCDLKRNSDTSVLQYTQGKDIETATISTTNISRSCSSSNSNSPGPSKIMKLSPSSSPPSSPLTYIHSTIYVGPSPTALRLDENYYDEVGDRSFLQKIVLVVLKSVAVTVKETRAESDSDDSGSDCSGSDSEVNDMMIIEQSIREVLQQVDAFVKSLLPFHPSTPLGEWMVKLFSDQDDALVEAMLCALDTFTGFHEQKMPTPQYFCTILNPVVTFIAFARTVSEDRDILLDLLMSNETSFLLYFLRFLKFSWKNWSEFVSTCGRDLEKIMGLLIRLRMAIGRLVEKSLFPYNINPVLRLLERCEERYESSSSNSNNTISTTS